MSLDAMSCEQVLESLESFVDGELDAAAATTAQAHLDGCPACAAEHRLATAVRDELRALPEMDPPRSVLLEVRHEIDRERFRKPTAHRAFRRRWATLAAAVLAAAVIGLSLWREPAIRPAIEPDPAAVRAAEIDRATEEARFALAYMGQITRRAGLKLRDDVLIERVAAPTIRGFTRALAPRPGREREADDAVDSDRS